MGVCVPAYKTFAALGQVLPKGKMKNLPILSNVGDKGFVASTICAWAIPYDMYLPLFFEQKARTKCFKFTHISSPAYYELKIIMRDPCSHR